MKPSDKASEDLGMTFACYRARLCTAFLSLTFIGIAVVAEAVQGIPEPGITFYGTCSDRQTGTPVTPMVVSWNVSDGTNNFTQTGTTTPAMQIISSDGTVYYAVEVAFQTRSVGSTTFQPPAPPSYALPMQTVSPTYTFTPSINGQTTVIKAINGQLITNTLPSSYTINDYSYASHPPSRKRPRWLAPTRQLPLWSSNQRRYGGQLLKLERGV